MGNSRFLLSIIIPTKNRQIYTIKAVEQILQINDDRIQVIIQDNSDTYKLIEMLEPFKGDNRLKYNYTKGVISFVDNFNLAVSLAEGEYACIIGDDDGVIPLIIDVTEWASKNGIEAVKPETSAVYFWPNSEAQERTADNGCLRISRITAKVKHANPYNEVRKLLNQGCQNYLSLDMAKLYHGIVKKECLDEIRKMTGSYFGGLSPDIYIAVALSLVVKKVIVVDVPLTISGICNKSGSADSATGRHTGILKDAPHFRGHDVYNWSELVPRIYSVETIWADSAIAALVNLCRTDLLDECNIRALFDKCSKEYPQFSDTIRLQYKRLKKDKGIPITEIKMILIRYRLIIMSVINRGARKIRRYIERFIYLKSNDMFSVNGVEDIINAGEIIQKRFIDINVCVDSVIDSLEKELQL